MPFQLIPIPSRNRTRALAAVALATLGAGCFGGGNGGTMGSSSNAPPAIPLINAGLPTCDTTQVFSVAPIAISDISTTSGGFEPIGALHPPGHTFPSDHGGFNIFQTSNPDGSRSAVPTNVYAPGSMTVRNILMRSPTDFKVVFLPCAQIEAWFDHMSDISPILERLGLSDPAQLPQGSCPGCPALVSATFEAGELLGRVGVVPENFAMDFGLYDATMAPLQFVDPSRIVASPTSFDDFHAACPFEYYSDATVKAELYSTVNRYFCPNANISDCSVFPTGPGSCGRIDVDLAGTAQGRWYPAGTVGPPADESTSVSLVPTFIARNVQAVSIGSSAVAHAPFSPNAYFFEPNPAGLVNRDISQVTADGNPYCYDTFTDQLGDPSGTSGLIILVEMTDATSLRIEMQSATSCMSAVPWTFSSPQNFVR